jgi:hypothetical protein
MKMQVVTMQGVWESLPPSHFLVVSFRINRISRRLLVSMF